MSDALTPDAPIEGAAVQEAPAPEVAVESASAGAEEPKVVPAERFNGLQSKYQSEKSEWERRQAAMEAELNSLRAKEQEKPEQVSDDKVEALQAQVSQLTELLMGERTESARAKVLDQYPDAKPFADLIVGGTPEEMEQVAKVLHERMQLIKGETPAVVTTTETNETVTPEGQSVANVTETTEVVPEHGGAVSATGQEALNDQVGQALASKDFEAFLRAKSALVEASMAQVS